jgi:hypothetical protein
MKPYQAALIKQSSSMAETLTHSRLPTNRTARTSAKATVLELIELQRTLQQRRQRLSSYIEGLSRPGRTLRGLQRSKQDLGHGRGARTPEDSLAIG